MNGGLYKATTKFDFGTIPFLESQALSSSVFWVASFSCTRPGNRIAAVLRLLTIVNETADLEALGASRAWNTLSNTPDASYENVVSVQKTNAFPTVSLSVY